MSFLKNLKIIHGEAFHYYGYSLIIDNNPGLLHLWERNSPQSIIVKRGGVLIQNNPLLCKTEIKNFNLTVKYDNSLITNNGYNAECATHPIDTWSRVNSESTVWISWSPIDAPDGEQILGYYIYYAEADQTQDLKPFIEYPECSM